MNREAFLAELRQRLSGLPQGELEERLAFYGEMIDDRLEDGLTEAEAAGELGTPEEVAAQVLAEVPMSTLIRERVRPKRKLGAGVTALLVLGSPIWLSLLIVVFAAGLSLYIVLWAVVLCTWAVAFSLAAGVLACLAYGAMYLLRANPGAAGCALGAALVCAGLTLIWIAACIAVTRGAAALTRGVWLGAKTRIGRKGN